MEQRDEVVVLSVSSGEGYNKVSRKVPVGMRCPGAALNCLVVRGTALLCTLKVLKALAVYLLIKAVLTAYVGVL